VREERCVMGEREEEEGRRGTKAWVVGRRRTRRERREEHRARAEGSCHRLLPSCWCHILLI
jgi:hypothetical protein